MAGTSICKSPQEFWEDMSSYLVRKVQETFFKLGTLVANNPWSTLICTLAFVGFSSIGLINFYIEKNPMKLWIPPDSDYFKDTQWLIDTFQTGFRLQKLLVTADNVLEPNVLQTLNEITNEVSSINVNYNENNYTLEDLCFKVPVINVFNNNRNKRSESNDSSNVMTNIFETSLLLNTGIYCSIVENFRLSCLKNNILDIWNYNEDLFRNLSKLDIIDSLNKARKKSSLGHLVDYTKSLGGISRNATGQIIGAKSLHLIWHTEVNFSSVNLDDVGNLIGTEDWVSMPLLLWEYKFIELLQNYSNKLPNMTLYYESGSSFGEVSKSSMIQDMDKLFLSIFFMFIYIQIILSRCNWLEIRFTLGSVGLLCVGLAYISACSWCSIFGVPFGPVHSSLPFLLMGLSIDDMFVMKACWEQQNEDESRKSLPIRIGLMVKHAGVSIVITTFTDVVALLVGAITILPSLKSFCIYAAVGVFFVFCYSVTFYVAIFTLDIKRIQGNRNGIFYCYKHKNPITLSTSPPFSQRLFAYLYKNIIFTIPFKTLTIIFTIAMTLYSIEGILKLEQRFDPKWFIPEGTYYKDYLDKYKFYYEDEGYPAMIILGDMDYNYEFVHLYEMVQEVRNESYIYDLDTWVEAFHKYMINSYEKDLNNITLSKLEFNTYLSNFLFSSVGGQYQVNMKFSNAISCGKPTPDLIASTMNFKFKSFKGPVEYIPAMNKIKTIIKKTNITTGDGYKSVWSKAFANWVTDEIIATEVERNIELALLCVMCCTIILITNLQMCFWIFLCVLLTLINVLGWMQRWGMTVDIVCCIGLELAIGLCVDYAAHVGHTFLTISQGNRSQRALQTVTSIGTAVLFGGGATLLSLSLLSLSKAYTFQSFFKIFLLVITFGLFNGLVFLPIILSIIGPKSYHDKSTGKVVSEKGTEMETIELHGKQQTNNIKEYNDYDDIEFR